MYLEDLTPYTNSVGCNTEVDRVLSTNKPALEHNKLVGLER